MHYVGDVVTNAGVVLGIILGLMMAFDMGGPVNKAAYTFDFDEKVEDCVELPVTADLEAFLRGMDESPELRMFLHDPEIDASEIEVPC